MHPLSADQRGHNADTPSAITKGGWRSILKELDVSLTSKNLSILAAGVAFYAMLSIFPAFAALIAIYGLVADPATVQRQISEIQGLIPAEVQTLYRELFKAL